MKMTVQVVGPVIDCPVEDVFTFFTNFENSPLYGRSIKTTKETEGPISVGTVFREESKIMGRSIKNTAEVTGFDPPTEFSYSNTFENGMNEEARFIFESVGSGTQMHGFAEVEIPKVPQMLSSFFAWQMKRQVRPLLEALKETIEATHSA